MIYWAIEVFDVPELSRDVRVNETGYISLPLMPSKVRAGGLTPFQLQDKLAELLQTNGLVSTPQVTVSMKEQHSEPITVTGSVRTPMVIQAVRQTTLLQVLSQAGGITESAGTSVIVTRPAPKASELADPDDISAPSVSQTFTISMSDILESGDSRFNIPLIGGDVVSVPRAGNYPARGWGSNSPGRLPVAKRPGPYDHAENAISRGRDDKHGEDEECGHSSKKSRHRGGGIRFRWT